MSVIACTLVSHSCDWQLLSVILRTSFGCLNSMALPLTRDRCVELGVRTALIVTGAYKSEHRDGHIDIAGLVVEREWAADRKKSL